MVRSGRRNVAGESDMTTERSVYRALGELRRGSPVLVGGGSQWLLLAAETASVRSIGEAAGVAGADGPVTLVVSADRVGGPEGSLVGFSIAASLAALARTSSVWLRELADPSRGEARPSLEALLAAAPVPAAGAAGLAAVKLARLAPVALLAATAAGVEERAARASVLSVQGADVLGFARRTGCELEVVASASVPLADAADARLVAFRPPDGGIEHLAIVVGDPAGQEAPLVRLHSECFTGDFLGSLRCDCGEQLRQAIRRMREEGAGVLLYLAQEGRGIGLVNKLRAYALQDRGLDTLDANRALGWDADERSFLIGATMLRGLGIDRVRLLTNNPDKIASLQGFGIEVVARVAHTVAPNGTDDAYLATKRRRFGHMIG